jgi:putative MATE family efflux protein
MRHAASFPRAGQQEEAVSNSPFPRKTFLAFLAPMMLSNILQSLFGTINSAYLGQMIGVDALAAASVFFPVIFFFIAFVMGLSSGASILIGQAWGAGEPATVKAVAGTTLSVALILATTIAVLGGLFSRELLVALATPPDILDAASAYARIIMLGMPLTFTFILWTASMRGVGDSLTPLLALSVSTIIGLVATPALIRGWLGLPRLGVASAAWAGAISASVTLLWLHLYLRWRGHALAIDAAFLRAMRPNGKLLRTVLQLGIPSALGMVTMSLAELVLLGLVNRFGSEATAAYGAVNQVMGLVQFPAISIAIAVSIFAAQAIGRGETGRLDAIVLRGLEMNVLLTGGLVLLAYLLSRMILSFFIIDAAVLAFARGLLHMVLWSAVLFGMATVFSAAMRASGTVWTPLSILIFAVVAIELPSAIVLSRLVGIEGIWMAYPIAFCSMCILQMAYYTLVWRRRAIRRLI